MHIFAKRLMAASVSVIFAGSAGATPPIVTAARAISGQGGSAYSEGAAAYGGDNVARGGASSAFSGGGSNSTQVDNDSGDTKTLGVALGQSQTAADGCLKGTKIAFGVLEWTDDSSKCERYRLARIAETAAASADTTELANFFMARANEWYLKAEGLE